ncbi:MAG: hypothetical protein AVDCRST_MAG87-1029 [uncultured Thermomicrobiales bacterium]|uniref:Uncharacterized protein n=1 Tax=uncultured Thermomicrobiales bacterium TaxID=1645740 RepID=A0A6J4UPX2_9BACT|nr:MAG: hypothetical protein AVDCRST_MAG87-1029 [uncultured Thermomicrobiales bacterium]
MSSVPGVPAAVGVMPLVSFVAVAVVVIVAGQRFMIDIMRVVEVAAVRGRRGVWSGSVMRMML